MALAALTMAAVAGCAVPTPPSTPPPAPEAPSSLAPRAPPSASSDQDFIDRVVGINARQTGMGRLAHGKAVTKPLCLFARRLKIEHIEWQKRLVLLAKHLKFDVTSPGDRPPWSS